MLKRWWLAKVTSWDKTIPMVIKRIPEIRGLSADEKCILAEELWRAASEARENSLTVSPEHMRLLEHRWAAFERDPVDPGVSWGEVRKRVVNKP